MSVNMIAASLRCSAVSESINRLNQTPAGMKQRILGPLFSRFRLSSRASDGRHSQFGQRALFFARILCQDLIQRKAVFFARKTKNKKEQGKPRNDMAAEVEQRVVQKMAEGDDDEHRAEGDERIAGA